MTDKQEMRLFGRAIKSRWPISDEIRAAVMEKVLMIAAKSDGREAIQAAKVLVAMDEINLKVEQEQATPVLRKFVGNASKLTAEQVVELLREGTFVDPSQLRHLTEEEMLSIRHELQAISDGAANRA